MMNSNELEGCEGCENFDYKETLTEDGTGRSQHTARTCKVGMLWNLVRNERCSKYREAVI